MTINPLFEAYFLHIYATNKLEIVSEFLQEIKVIKNCSIEVTQN